MKTTDFDLFAFFELTPDLVCIAGKDGYFRKINPAVIQTLGYSAEELFAQPISHFIHPSDRHQTSERREKLLNGKTLVNFENRYVTKTGGIVWLEWSSIYLPKEEVVFAIAKDVTERKLIQLEVENKYNQYKSLATHFKASIESDRKYLATELHEELAQLASVIKMDIDWMSKNVPELQADTRKRMQHTLVISEMFINTIRRLSFSISPGMLDDLGLNATLGWHCKEFSILNGIPCYFEADYDEQALSREIKMDFFRVCQESLMNVMYHAQASQVNVRIKEKDRELFLSIEDNGKGFDPELIVNSGGLSRIRERARSINGRLSVYSKPGEGTRINVVLDQASN